MKVGFPFTVPPFHKDLFWKIERPGECVFWMGFFNAYFKSNFRTLKNGYFSIWSLFFCKLPSTFRSSKQTFIEVKVDLIDYSLSYFCGFKASLRKKSMMTHLFSANLWSRLTHPGSANYSLTRLIIQKSVGTKNHLNQLLLWTCSFRQYNDAG